MIYGDQKSRVMARSILPSRYRAAARDRAFIHRNARHEIRQTLRGLTVDDWEEGVDFAETTWLRVGMVVNCRRGADKLNHFRRWASARARLLPKGDRLDSLRGVLPEGLIGAHALEHLERDTRLSDALPGKRWVKKTVFLDRGELAQVLRRLVTVPDAVRSLHRCLKSATRKEYGKTFHCVQLRLHGPHDVLRFLHDAEKHRVTRSVIDDFVRVFKMTNDAQRACDTATRCVTLPIFDWSGTWVPA